MMMPSSSPLIMMGDYIGMESCVDVLKEGDEEYHDFLGCNINKEGDDDDDDDDDEQQQRIMVLKKKKLVFPPPIPLLARTQNLPCRMPWVLTRHYTSDGRLILTEEKLPRHEYFRAHRSNGRLTLQLVPLDEDDDDVVLASNENDHHIPQESNGLVVMNNEDKEEEEDNGINIAINNGIDIEIAVEGLNHENNTTVIDNNNNKTVCLNCNSSRHSVRGSSLYRSNGSACN
ncbi:uncharacterized protein LOC115696877 [Cannabis sativa]|uniref:uncharacterized protein LOC115696877 n=1 Tax=Cannabis sativa TaxID=3483 RepID=UPI0029C9B2F6|nr:uncharacterized protein LOC115696877 [Cannabis sativa]